MENRQPLAALPPIPAKRYFTIGEVSDLCAVKPHVLRYWEQEFTQLRPMKRRGNRRYYQHHEVLLIRKIRELLYDQGFTISGARNQLIDTRGFGGPQPEIDHEALIKGNGQVAAIRQVPARVENQQSPAAQSGPSAQSLQHVREGLLKILAVLKGKNP